MTDNETVPGALGAKSIDINNPEEVLAWSRELEIPEQRLREVIDMIGPMTAAIRFYVASPKFKSSSASPESV